MTTSMSSRVTRWRQLWTASHSYRSPMRRAFSRKPGPTSDTAMRCRSGMVTMAEASRSPTLPQPTMATFNLRVGISGRRIHVESLLAG